LGQTITISVGTETEYESELSDIEQFRLADMVNGNFVEIEGFEDTDAITGTVFASQVKIVDFADADGIEVQANIDETTDNEVIIVLGVAFDVTTATFEDSDDNSIANEALFNEKADLNPLISVTAASDDGVAVKVELE